LPRNILFLVEPGREWIGGVYYVRNVLKTLSVAPWFRECSVHVLVRDEFRSAFQTLEKDIPGLRLHVRREAKPSWERWAGQFLKPLGYVFDREVSEVSRRVGADLVFPVHHRPFFGLRGTQVHWIPDFQELHLPQYFTADELAKRAAYCAMVAAGKAPLILSSRAALADWDNCAPVRCNRAWILPFISDIETEIEGLDPSTEASLLTEIGLWEDGGAKPYFYVPNQFWQHKNHEVILDALELLQARGRKLPTVVCTGSVSDHRSKDHATRLLERVERSGLGDRFRVLSLVRRPQQLAIMRNARAVLQPSRFEGWNTGIQEALRLGRPLILSSLDVHREQAPEVGHFFDPDSAQELAELLCRDWPEVRPSEDVLREEARMAASRYAEGVRELFQGPGEVSR